MPGSFGRTISIATRAPTFEYSMLASWITPAGIAGIVWENASGANPAAQMIERTEIEEGIALELISYVALCQNQQIFNTYDVCILTARNATPE